MNTSIIDNYALTIDKVQAFSVTRSGTLASNVKEVSVMSRFGLQRNLRRGRLADRVGLILFLFLLMVLLASVFHGFQGLAATTATLPG